jgi:hypothetical protein
MSDTRKQKKNKASGDRMWDIFSPLWTGAEKRKYKEELRQQHEKVERKKRDQFRHNAEEQK